MDSKKIVKVLYLNCGEDGSSTLYRLAQKDVLQFRLGPSLLGREIKLFTNHPTTREEQFQRVKFREIKFKFDSSNTMDDTAAFVDLEMVLSGSFRYYFTMNGGEYVEGSGYFLVDPELKAGSAGESIPLDAIQCQSVLSKNLGDMKTWESKLLVAKNSGYNVIHFTPVQVLGGSNSAYSLGNHHELNENFNTDWATVEKFIDKMDKDWSILSICDIVLNHTANETPWIFQQPDATYNCLNSPHLRPAFLLDRIMYHLSIDIEDGKWISRGIPKAEVSTEQHLDICKSLIYDHYFPQSKIFEFFMMDIPDILEQFEKMVLESDPPTLESCHSTANEAELKIIQDPQYRRMKSTIDMALALKLFNVSKGDSITEEKRISLCSSELKKQLDRLNNDAYSTAWSHLQNGVENVIKGARYHRVQADGPKAIYCGHKEPLVTIYFTGPQKKTSLEEEEKMAFGEEGAQFMAHNGWVMDHDPLINFALSGSNVYLRRELVAWGDSVKLRFGEKPDDSPFLWKYMKEYAENTAKIFHGIRLDNCHSTPIHVAEFMLDAARSIRPNLYVIAELFTSSEGFDNQFINRLGINSLIREAMTAWDSHELGRLVHRFGGEPVGSFIQPLQRPLVPVMAHAIFFDQTHDNPSPVEKRSAYDLVPSAALVTMASCAIGSNRGYDEIVPHHIHVVHETRTYLAWGVDAGVTEDTGMIKTRKILNDLHTFLGKNGFSEVYVDQMSFDIVAVTRHNPVNHKSVVLVAHTMFNKGNDPQAFHGIKPVQVEGKLVQVLVEANTKAVNSGTFVKDETVINGLENIKVEVKDCFDISQSKLAEVETATDKFTKINLKNFTPGSVIAFMFELNPEQAGAAESVRKAMTELVRPESEIAHIVSKLNLLDLNHILFKCDQEERAGDSNKGVYCLDGYGPLKYAGIQGFMSILSEIRPKNDLGNWLPSNLRNGNWMLDYITSRLKENSGTRALGELLDEKCFKSLKIVPRYLIPRYFDVILTSVYVKLLDRVWKLMSPFVQNGSHFNKALALGSVQHMAVVGNAPLPKLAPDIQSPKPDSDSLGSQLAPTIAAGLPHFSTGYMRSWGRDTFIALRGFLILTGRYQEARYIILGYGACLRHGLIPNLLDGGRNSRFNCRDATWWWLHCIVSYVEQVPDGRSILQDKVSRLFPRDGDEARKPGECDQNLEDVMQEALQKHFQGLKFRERNAGTSIDEHMKDEGFNNEIGVDINTGFVFGGNSSNCGTWMDKMGSSAKAGNKGIPSTPRDGSAVEIVGLSFATLNKLSEFNEKGFFKHHSVEKLNEKNQKIVWTYKEWAEKIKSNFEDHFYISRSNPNEKRKDLINKEFIYKDTLNSSHGFTDYQLRCNFPITMAVAPELFDPPKALKSLEVVKQMLLGPLGLATLDPEDWAYRGDYDNSNDSDDSKVAHGANYHQGPEWVWPVGFFLRAYLYFAKKVEGPEGFKSAKSFVMSVMSAHFSEVQLSHWRGIPELTNSRGKFCPGSNPIQAWSMSCLLEVLYDLEQT